MIGAIKLKTGCGQPRYHPVEQTLAVKLLIVLEYFAALSDALNASAHPKRHFDQGEIVCFLP